MHQRSFRSVHNFNFSGSLDIVGGNWLLFFCIGQNGKGNVEVSHVSLCLDRKILSKNESTLLLALL